MIEKLGTVFKQFEKEISLLTNKADILNLKAKYIGKKGEVSEVLQGLKDLILEERQKVGPVANEIKDKIQNIIQDKLNKAEIEEINDGLKQNRVDVTRVESAFVNNHEHGGLHPITLIQQEVENIFLSMGFEVLDGPHIENEHNNFIALNIPADHPARDMQDTFWFHSPSGDVEKKALLRTHTSCVQIRGMKERRPPFRFIAPGKVFRCERTDASHEMVFHQTEGMLVGENISVTNLIYFMKVLLSEIFKKDVEVRLRPGFFPFVEPGFELDIKCLICGGTGCSVCKQVGWVELLPCGMVHPSVLQMSGIDPAKYNGFAFGLGLDRLVMMRYGIDDIRHFHSGDLRFVSQFKSY